MIANKNTSDRSKNGNRYSQVKKEISAKSISSTENTPQNGSIPDVGIFGSSDLSASNEMSIPTSIAKNRKRRKTMPERDAAVKNMPGKSGVPVANDEFASEIPVRRSKRQRISPLAPRQNQRISCKDGETNVLGINEKTKYDNESIKQLEAKVHGKKKQNHKNPVRLQEAKIINPATDKPVKFQLLRKFDSEEWDLPAQCLQGCKHSAGFQIKRMIDTDKAVFGYIKIAIGKEKPLQFMPEEDLQLSAIVGEIEVHIQENMYKLSSHDMVVVPGGIPYKIKNVSNEIALVAYAVGKFDIM